MRDSLRIIKDESGASMIYALLFMLVATMVSIVLLVASSTAVARIHAEQERTQSMLVLRSAGDAVRSSLLSADCSIITRTVLESGASTTSVSTPDDDNPLDVELRSALAQVVNGLAHEGSFVVSVPESADAGKLAGTQVTVSYTMEPKEEESDSADAYKIVATLSLDGCNERLFLTATRAASSAPIPVTEDGVTTKTEKVNWDDVVLTTKEGVA